MNKRNSLACLLSTALALGSAQGAAAGDAGAALLGFGLGAVVGHEIARNRQQQRVIVRDRAYRAPVNSYQREANRQVQTSLNYFGFPAGAPDGVLGRNSRAAIGQYQAFMGYPATGVLSDYEQVFLTSSYNRAIVGGPQNAQIMASSGQGTRGLLLAYRQEAMGGAPVAAGAPAAPVLTAPEVAVTAKPQAEPAPVVEALAIAPEAAPSGGMPSFLPGQAAQSMASACNRTNLATSANGGFVTLASMTDPTLALGEQFCLARTYAIEQGDSLAATVQGFSMAEMQQQCEAFAPSMREYQARIASQSPDEASRALQDFVIETAAPPAQLSGNARICLGIGYRTDNADLAVAGAMVLVGLGETTYTELLAYHLMNGFGLPKRPDRGLEWLAVAVEALESGAVPLVSAGGENRVALLRQAHVTLSGTQALGETLQDAAAPTPGFVLPAPKAASN